MQVVTRLVKINFRKRIFSKKSKGHYKLNIWRNKTYNNLNSKRSEIIIKE